MTEQEKKEIIEIAKLASLLLKKAQEILKKHS